MKIECFSRKRSQNIAKPNGFQRRIFEIVLLRMLRQSKMYLPCLEMQVARMNFDLILLAISYQGSIILRCMT